MKIHVKRKHNNNKNNNMDEQHLEAGLNDAPQELRSQPKLKFEVIEDEGSIYLLTANQEKISLSQMSNNEDSLSIKDTKCQTIPFTCTGIHGLGGQIVVFGSTDCLVTNVNEAGSMGKYFRQ